MSHEDKTLRLSPLFVDFLFNGDGSSSASSSDLLFLFELPLGATPERILVASLDVKLTNCMLGTVALDDDDDGRGDDEGFLDCRWGEEVADDAVLGVLGGSESAAGPEAVRLLSYEGTSGV
jgi:hypothetical protein